MKTTTAPDELVVYADYVCPFCRLGNSTLGEYLDGRAERGLPGLDVTWRPFDLRSDDREPDGSIRDGAREGKDEYVRSRWPEVESLAEEYGVEMTMNVEQYLGIDARNAQLVALGLRRDDPEYFRPFHDSVFEALWTEIRDVGDPDILRDLVDGAGGDPDRVAEWIEDGTLQEQFEAATRRATGEGVRGVPTVVYDGQTVYGSQPPEGYRGLIEG